MDYGLSFATWLWILVPLIGIIGLSVITLIYKKE